MYTFARRESPDEKENSLGALTKRFIDAAADAPQGLVQLNLLADQLGVSKRRMYDITNVLEGINLVEKQNKNVVHWRYGLLFSPFSPIIIVIHSF